MAKKKKKSKNVLKKIIFVFSAIIVFLLIGAGIIWKRYLVDSVTEKSFWIYIDKSSTLENVLEDLGQNIAPSEVRRIARMAKLNNYNPKNQPGAYRIDPQMGAFKVYRKLSHGTQNPIRFTFNNLRTKEELAERIGNSFMISKSDVLALLNNPSVATDYGFDRYTFVSMFIPDTYEMYWTISSRRFLDKMYDEYVKFWNEERKKKASEIGLTLQGVSTLASIVEEETKAKDEMKVVAGLYLNRLKKGMLLQADPTVKFAINDFGVKRILHEHLNIDSPYNTYKNLGLPPGPIRIPSKAAIEAVLNYEHHDYIYMCAKEDFSGRHNFATTYTEHLKNALRYQKALNKRNIMK
ncbi:endolytic transglycosylase MltG [Coprobacter secundus]|jgi:hypothetical protein|uniref:endolytic transglycosylase MltG n=1 Tax=Coprobacter secundus TaxID=1501392 RepID=UPI00057380DF|nr:endolytic transglycosylase MltG [Coprobacter secundus]KHM44973.1 aminodeoxychorismate lyase [Coprobacter secundus]